LIDRAELLREMKSYRQILGTEWGYSSIAVTVLDFLVNEVNAMSEARWCDYADHAYKGGREGTIMLGQTTKKDAYGNVHQDVREMCPECAAGLGLIDDYEAPAPPSQRKVDMLKGLEK
jgi:hypothetical protein